MANGHALLFLDPEPISAPAFIEAATSKPTEIEVTIGETVARAGILVCVAMEKYREGQPTIAVNMQGAELIAKLYELKQSAPDLDFDAVAAREGKAALHRTLALTPGAAEVLCQGYSVNQAFDEILSWPLGVLAKVTKEARTWAN